MRRLRLTSALFKLPVSQARLRHTNSFSGLTENQLSQFQYLGNVGLSHFRSRDFSWYEIRLIKTLTQGNHIFTRNPLSVEEAVTRLDDFKRFLDDASNKKQLDLLNELYPYGFRREHLDLTKIRPTDEITPEITQLIEPAIEHDNYMELVHIVSIFDGDTAAMFYTGDWVEFFKQAFKHHVMRKVTGVDEYADPRGISHNHDAFFAKISREPESLTKAVEDTLGEIVGMSRRELALYSYGIEKKNLSYIERDLESYYRAREKLWKKRYESQKAFTATVDSSSPKL